MSSPGASVNLTDNDVRVQLVIAIIQADVHIQLDLFYLLSDPDRLVVFGFPIKIAESDPAKSANAAQLRGMDLMFPRKFQNLFIYLLSGFKHQRNRLESLNFMQKFGFHLFLSST